MPPQAFRRESQEFSGVRPLNSAIKTVQIGLGLLSTVVSLSAPAFAQADVSLFRLQSMPANVRTVTT